jgi:predicted nucleic acid-binding protein
VPAPLVVLLDTNHLSDLARHPAAADPAAILTRLEKGDAALAISLFHLLELSDPRFKSSDDMRALLRSVPHVLANPYENVEDEEMAVACARATGLIRRPPRVWARDTSEWGYHAGPAGGSAADMLEAFKAMGDERDSIHAYAEHGARGSMMKGDAALIRQPLLPLTLALRRHIDLGRLRLPSYAGGLSAEQVIERVGGNTAFPGYHMHEALLEQRMKDPRQKSTANDVYDEFIAFYAPYAAVTAVDKRTLHRAKMANVRAVARMTRHLSEVPSRLDAVARGELAVTESAF